MSKATVKLLPGAQPTHCAGCFISSGCYWGCLRANDYAEIAALRAAMRGALDAIGREDSPWAAALLAMALEITPQ